MKKKSVWHGPKIFRGVSKKKKNKTVLKSKAKLRFWDSSNLGTAYRDGEGWCVSKNHRVLT